MARRARKGPGAGKAAKAGRDLATASLKAAAMPAAAAFTIGQRLPVLARGLARPNRKDGAEIGRMVTEKAKAAAEVAGIVAKGTSAALAQTAKAARGASPPAATRSSDPLTAAQAWVGWWSAATVRACQPWWTAADVVNRALTPVHRRVTANAKRLGKPKRGG